jgi:hypothetical protein
MCGAGAGGAAVGGGVDLATATIIEGVVRRGEAPVEGAYVRLLDATGEFTAEVPTDAEGQFRFFAAPGRWTVRILAPRATVTDRPVSADRGDRIHLEVALDG